MYCPKYGPYYMPDQQFVYTAVVAKCSEIGKCIFCRFWDSFREAEHHPKSRNLLKKSFSKNEALSDTLFDRIFMILTLVLHVFFDMFGWFFNDVQKHSNALKHWLCAEKSRCGPLKNHGKSNQNLLKSCLKTFDGKTLEKMCFGAFSGFQKPGFWEHFASKKSFEKIHRKSSQVLMLQRHSTTHHQ